MPSSSPSLAQPDRRQCWTPIETPQSTLHGDCGVTLTFGTGGVRGGENEGELQLIIRPNLAVDLVRYVPSERERVFFRPIRDQVPYVPTLRSLTTHRGVKSDARTRGARDDVSAGILHVLHRTWPLPTRPATPSHSLKLPATKLTHQSAEKNH